MKFWAYLPILLMVFGASAHAQPAPGANCTKATSEIDRVICGDKSLSGLDTQLANEYTYLRGELYPYNSGLVRASEIRWISNRNKVCGQPAFGIAQVSDCLRRQYLQRIEDLRKPQSCAVSANNENYIVCNDATLSKERDQLEGRTDYAGRHLSKDSSEVLKQVEEQWYSDVGNECGLNVGHTLGNPDEAKKCLLGKFAERYKQLSVDLSTPPPAKYRLSPFELLVVAQESDGNFGGFNYDPKISPLRRLLSAIILSQDDIDDFLSAISGPGPFVETKGERFIFGQACTAGACDVAKGAFIADTRTGDVVFATGYQKDLTIYEKACADDELKTYAKQRFMAPWFVDSGPVNPHPAPVAFDFEDPLDGPFTDDETEVKVSPCR